jgi:dipeptidyl aminopeptidase/acylaminoacyl peptidase
LKRHYILLAFGLLIVVAIAILTYIASTAYDVLSLPGGPIPPATPTGKFEDVTFPSRGHNYKVYGFYLPGQPDAPALISVHGWKATRHDKYHLDRAAALRDLGYTVLTIDLQDNGGDTVEDGRLSMGYKERYDVLGAFDYLLSRGFTADKIGLVGESEGGSTILMAAGLEPRIKAIWEDSGYTRADSVVTEQAQNFGYPPFVVLPGMAWGFLKTGDRIWEVTPIDLGPTFAANKQAVYIIHAEQDTRVLYHHGVDLYNAYQKAGVDVTFWSLPDTDLPDNAHAVAITYHHDEYMKRLDEFFKQHLGTS